MTSERHKVVALLSAFNEADIIDQVIRHLVDQGVVVWFIDDGSTDETAAIAERWRGRGLIGLERRSRGSGEPEFSWTAILKRKEALAAEIDAEWFIHHDADEFRECPWPGLTLAGALAHVEALGYNAVDFRVLNFRPTDGRFQAGVDVREAFTYFEPAERHDALQIKCWRKTNAAIDLVSSAGHDVRFADRRVLPVPFLLRHYPIRSQSHGEQKVLVDRLPRFDPGERARGWHRQYDAVAADKRFLWDAAGLTRYDADQVRRELAVVPDGSGLVRSLEASLAEAEAMLATERSRLALERQALGEDLKGHARALDLARAELAALRASSSWRVTAPLRVVYQMVTGASPANTAGEARDSRVEPASRQWGLDRGLPIDRHYINGFLDRHRQDIRGRVLEIKDAGYTRAFGDDRVTDVQVLDIRADNPHATIVADLSTASGLVPSQFDCIILTQTLHIIYDIRAALANAARLLAPGGVMLCTLPAVSPVNPEDGGLESGDYWRLAPAAVQRMFAECFRPDDVRIETFGNARVGAAFLSGLAAEELSAAERDPVDPWHPLIYCVRAARPARTS